MHIVTIRSLGEVVGFQLRLGAGGPGNTKYFATSTHGSETKAWRAAQRMASNLGVGTLPSRGGSQRGRLLKTSTTRAAGIRFVWTDAVSGPVLRVVASWTDRRGTPRSTSYSVERNGLDGALDKAILARTSAGAEPPDRAALMKRLRNARRAGGLESETA